MLTSGGVSKPAKTNIDTNNDGVEDVSPFQTWRHFW